MATADEDEDSIALLQDAVPQLDSLFIITRCIGHGTFSSVYLARTKHTTTINGRRHFAIKHIIPTCHPSRVYMELKCLKMIGGTDNVMGVTMSFRRMNHIVLVMPHFPHDSFSDYVGCLSIHELQDYLRNLLVALRRVHSFKIIHRDIKPANFLYNRKLKRYSLVDFGLAQEVRQVKKAVIPTMARKGSGIKAGASDKFLSRPTQDTPQLNSGKTVKRKLVIYSDAPENEKTKRARNMSPPTPYVAGVLSSTSNRINATLRRSPRKECSTHVSPKKENNESAGMTKVPITPKKTDALSFVHQDSPSKHTRNAEASSMERDNATGTDSSQQVHLKRLQEQQVLRRSPRKLASSNISKNLPEDQPQNVQSKLSLSALNKIPAKFGGKRADDLVGNSSFKILDNTKATTAVNAATPNHHLMATNKKNSGHILQEVKTRTGSVLRPVSCHCYGSGRVCGVCATRANQMAPRAGTPGFRAPEVLLRHPEQGTAVDLWSVGVILVCLLSGHYPFFHAADDLSTLAEISTLLGTDTIRKTAAKLGKLFTCSEDRKALDLRKLCEALLNGTTATGTGICGDSGGETELCSCCQQAVCLCLVPPPKVGASNQGQQASKKRSQGNDSSHSKNSTYYQKKSSISSNITSLSPAKKKTKAQIYNQNCPKKLTLESSEPEVISVVLNNSLGGQKIIDNMSEEEAAETLKSLHSSNISVKTPVVYPPYAYDLLSKLLDPNPETRITAEEALAHPFLTCQQMGEVIV